MPKFSNYDLESLKRVPRSHWKIFKFKAIFQILLRFLFAFIVIIHDHTVQFSTGYIIDDDITGLTANKMYADKVHVLKVLRLRLGMSSSGRVYAQKTNTRECRDGSLVRSADCSYK